MLYITFDDDNINKRSFYSLFRYSDTIAGGRARGALCTEQLQGAVTTPNLQNIKKASGGEMKVEILGTEYEIEYRSKEEDELLRENNGYCDTSIRKIVIDVMDVCEVGMKGDLAGFKAKVLRHEIIHAFLHESGLDSNSIAPDIGWAYNEEMVDWFAIQAPKTYKAYKETGCI